MQENVRLVVVRRKGDCHVLCARPGGCARGQMPPQQPFEAAPHG